MDSIIAQITNAQILIESYNSILLIAYSAKVAFLFLLYHIG